MIQQHSAGRTSPIHRAHCGMPWNGKAKPDNRIAGKRKNSVICIAWSWFSATVENV